MMNVFSAFGVSLTHVDIFLYKQNCSIDWRAKSIFEQLKKLSWTVLVEEHCIFASKVWFYQNFNEILKLLEAFTVFTR